MTVSLIACWAGAGVAEAAVARIHWSTYMRAGPGAGYAAIDELEHGTPVDLGACAGAWCRVTAGAVVGYVDQDSLFLPQPPSGAAVGGQDCFSAAQTSYRGPAATRFCTAAPVPPAAAPVK